MKKTYPEKAEFHPYLLPCPDLLTKTHQWILNNCKRWSYKNVLCLGISKFTLTWCCFDSRFFMWYVRRWVFMRLHQTSKHSSAMPSLFKNALYSTLLSHQEKNVRVCCHFLGFLLTALMLHLHEEIILRNLDKQNTAKELWPCTLRQSTKLICALL